MKLNEIYKKLMNWDTSQVNLVSAKESPDRIRVKNVTKFKSFAADVEQIPSFVEVVQAFKRTALYLSSADQITVNRKNFQEIYKLHTKMFAFVEVLGKTLGENLERNSEQLVILKFSDPDDHEQALKILKLTQALLSPILSNNSINGKATVKSWDMVAGEASIFVGSDAAIQLVGRISESALLVCHMLREGRIIYEYVQDLKVKDESLLDITSGHEKAIQDLVDDEIEKTLQDYFSGEKNSELGENLKLAVRRFAELFDSGMEIQPAHNAPEKVRRQFPNLKKKRAAEPQIKLVPEAA